MVPVRTLCLAVPLGLSAALLSASAAQVAAPLAPEALPQSVNQPVVQPLPGPETQAEDAGFAGYVQLLSARARGEGVSEATIRAMTAGLSYNPRVVGYDRAQPGSTPNSPPNFWPYYRKHIDAARINGGRAVMASAQDVLPAIEAEYGVPAKMLVAIWGKESYYGRIQGDFDLARSLASLAYEGRRRALFEGEFIALLKMADRGVPRWRMVGSWAGAFGNPQFLPSVYLRLARDGDGDGTTDIWNSRADTLASVANYFRDAGWRTGEPWGVRASIAPTFDRSGITPRLAAPSCTRVHQRHSLWKTVAEWRALGVSPQAAIPETAMATLFEPDGPGNGSFLLTGNYRVILHYNCSNYYALSVGLLADEIAR
jgi:membrane-bound lytic murein transglycosylase B